MHKAIAFFYVCAGIFLFAPSLALALTVTVPDDFATIQAAMDSDADSVLVADGVYNENLVMKRSVSVLADVVSGYGGYTERIPMPQVLGFSIQGSYPYHPNGRLEGLRFRGPVALSTGSCALQFESCRFDSGVTTEYADENRVTFRGCQIYRQCSIRFKGWAMVNCTVMGTGIEGVRPFEAVTVRDNLIVGPAAFGISFTENMGLTITGNTVIGTTDGIVSSYAIGGSSQGSHTCVRNNEVRNCSGTAFRHYGGYRDTLEGNRVIACGGRGLDVRGEGMVIGNTVDSVGADGIYATSGVFIRNNTITHVAGNGIAGPSNGALWSVVGNRIVGAGLDGITCIAALRADSNVIGRAGGGGIVMHSGVGAMRLRGNTVYRTGGTGIVTAGVDSVDHNIVAGCGGYGLTWSGAAPRYLSCNDWFGNGAGATWGIAPGASDLSVNPLFCDLPNDDVHLSAGSPLANAPGCGAIGALGVGCASAVSVEGPGTFAGPMFAAIPSPSRGHVSFAIRGVSTAAAVEVFDLTGARRWRGTWQPGESGLQWDGRDAAGQAVAPGVYYARLTSGVLVRSARVVLVR